LMRAKASPDPRASETPVEFRWALYAASVFLPFAGIVIALFLIESDSKPARRVGRLCLFTGFLVWVLLPAMVITGILLTLAAAVVGFLSEFAQLL